MKIILASGSPRRKELLKLVVPEFEIIVSGTEENIDNNLTPEEQATKLSYSKAKNVFESEEQVVWICRNCGHIHFGNEAPKVCPICTHPQSYFERKANNY